MKRFRSIFLTLAIPGFLSAQSASTQLRYLAEQPVLQKSQVSVEVAAPGLLSSQGGHPLLEATQNLESVLEIQGEAGQPISQLPIDLFFSLRGLTVGIEANGHSVSYSSDHPDSSAFMKELSKSIGEPVRVRLGNNLKMDASSRDFLKLVRDMEKLDGFKLNNLITEVFQQLFALAGEDLQIGQTYTQNLTLGGDAMRPISIVYEIADITDKEVRAKVSGGFQPVRLPVTGTLLGGQPTADKSDAYLTIGGKIEGKAVWSRKNALIYKTRFQYLYEGELEEGSQSIPIQVRLKQQSSTKAL